MAEQLSAAHLRRVLAVLERCEPAASLDDWRDTVLDAAARELGYRHMTFFLGGDMRCGWALDLATPRTTGVARANLEAYQGRWHGLDAFSSGPAVAGIVQHGVVSLEQLVPGLTPPHRGYLDGFLFAGGMRDQLGVWLDTGRATHGLLGVIGTEAPTFGPVDRALWAVLRRHLAPRLAGQLPDPVAVRAPAGLTPRQAEVADLVAQGLDNRQVARRLAVSEETVKKHLTRAMAALGVQSRTQLALAWRATGSSAAPGGRGGTERAHGGNGGVTRRR